MSLLMKGIALCSLEIPDQGQEAIASTSLALSRSVGLCCREGLILPHVLLGRLMKHLSGPFRIDKLAIVLAANQLQPVIRSSRP